MTIMTLNPKNDDSGYSDFKKKRKPALMHSVTLAPPEAVHEQAALEQKHRHSYKSQQRIHKQRARGHGVLSRSVAKRLCNGCAALHLACRYPGVVWPLEIKASAAVLHAHP